MEFHAQFKATLGLLRLTRDAAGLTLAAATVLEDKLSANGEIFRAD